jgi:hypothetical protein
LFKIKFSKILFDYFCNYQLFITNYSLSITFTPITLWNNMTFEFNFVNKLNGLLTAELPDDLRTLDQHLDFILPTIKEYSEDVGELNYWTNRRWKEIREGDQFHESILHIFTPTNEYLLAIDGNIINGNWQKLGEYNTMILEMAGRKELFDLHFMNDTFMVLSKHGNQTKEGYRKYFFLVEETKTRNAENGTELNWRRLCEMLYNVFREQSSSFVYWIIALIILGASIAVLSS